MNKKPYVLHKGIVLDSRPEYQNEGTYRFALNAVRETEIGDLGAISNEKGNQPCFEHNLGSGFHLVGDCNIGNGQVLLFFTDSTDTVIGIVQDCIFRVLIRTECLGISIHDYVDVEYRVHNGCDTIIYFTDGHSKYRSINISKLDRYKKETYADPNVDINGVYGWDCGLFNLSPDYDQVKIFLDKVSRGGRLRIGSYQFAVRHMDDQYNPTGWSLISNPIPVTLDNSNSTHASSGGVYGPPDVDGFRYVDKSIGIIIDNIDTRYNYYQIAILQATAGTFEINEVHTTSPIPIESSTANFTLDSTSGLEVSSLQSVVVNNRVVPVVQAHTQVENRLILGNLKSPEKDWLQFQRVANAIQVEYVVYESEEDTEYVCGYDIAHGEGSLTHTASVNSAFITDNGTANHGKSYSNPNVVFDNKTYMRDEVYALGVVFVFEDGGESPVMHIPGRPKLGSGPNAVPSYTVNGFNYTPAVGQSYWNDLREMYNTSGVTWDDVEYSIDSTLEPYVLSENNDPDDVLNKDSIHTFEDVYQSGNCSVNTIPRWKHVNTSIKRSDDVSLAYDQTVVERRYGIVEAGLMGYYEADTTYPKVLGCDGNPVFPYHLDNSGEIVMDKIRHHKMPDSRKSHIQRREIRTLTIDTPQGPVVIEYPVLIIRPIGVAFHNIDLTGLNVSHYYFVKSDRAGNKTVLDKGWMNVTDLSCALVFDIDTNSYRGVMPTSQNRTIEQNVIFMSPHSKSGMTNTTINDATRSSFKDPDTTGGYDIVEVFSPKLVYNSIVNLGPSHFKLENTVYGNITKFRTENQGSHPRVSMACFFDRMDQPRVAVGARAFYALTHLLPVKSMEFALYNQVSASTMLAGYTIENDKFQQVMGLAHLYDNIENYSGFLKLFRSPYMYGAISLPDGLVPSGVVDILTHNTQDAGEFNDTTPTTGGYVVSRNTHDLREIIDRSSSVNSPNFVGSAFRSSLVLNNGIGAYAYYVALKSSVTPYRKLDAIKYNRCSNYNFNSGVNYTSTIVTGGDIFISPMRMYRSYFEGEDEENLNRRMFIASHLTGLVESEINCNYRHKDPLGLYMAYPFDSLTDTVDTQINELREDIRERIEQGYEYNVDLSRDNSARQLFALPDYYDYCLDCQESFPNLIIYSDQVNAEQVEDWYKAFQVNNIIEIPPDTGAVTDMTLKENNMFVHTQGNTWRLNISNQQIQTNNDVIEVGSNSLGNATPTKLFDNDSGLFRGGLEFKQSAVHCDDMYIWTDTITNHVYALQGGVKELSDLGLKTWFDTNLTMYLRDQFRRLSWLHYGVNRTYPYMNTSSAFDTGTIATYDPQIKRYILTKKDYELLPQFESTVIPIPDPPYSLNQVYLGVDGYYIATDANTLIRIEVNNNAFFRSKSWTISYDTKTNSWWSYHSYIPNYMYRDDDNYYSFIENPNQVLSSNYRNYLWAHNSNFYQTYYDIKQDFVIDFVYTSDAYQDKTFDNFELAVNSYVKDAVSNEFKNEQFIIPNLFYVYNNTQLSGYRGLVNTATSPYERVNYSITSSIDRDRNVWRVSRFRDMSVNRLTSPSSMFTTAWTAPYSAVFFSGFGYIDKVINPNYISTSKNVYQQERFTDKYLGVRINWNNTQNAKINVNLLSALNRTRK